MYFKYYTAKCIILFFITYFKRANRAVHSAHGTREWEGETGQEEQCTGVRLVIKSMARCTVGVLEGLKSERKLKLRLGA